MKKTLVAGVAALAFATAAFAEITFGAWLCVLPTLVANDGKDTTAFQSNPWGYGARSARIDINAVSDDEKAGFNMNVYNDAFSGLGDGDQARLWLKPIDQVKLSVGHVEENALRGDLCYGSWNWLRPTGAWLNKGEGFSFDNWNKRGFLVQVEPVENVYLHVGVPLLDKDEDDNWKKASDIYKSVHVAGAYTIDGVGKLKAGYFGEYSKTKATKAVAAKAAVPGVYIKGTDKSLDTYTIATADAADASYKKGDMIDSSSAKIDPDTALIIHEPAPRTKPEPAWDEYEKMGKIGVAFDLTAVENLYVTAGFRYLIADDEYYKHNLYYTFDLSGLNEDTVYDYSPEAQMNFALGASYQVMPELKVYADFAMDMYKKVTIGEGDDAVDIKIDPRYAIGVGAEYAISDTLSLDAEVDYKSALTGKMSGKNWEAKLKDYEDAKGKKIKTDHVAFLVGVKNAVGSNGSIGIGFQGMTNNGAFSSLSANSVKSDKDAKTNAFLWAVPVRMSVWF